MILSDPHSVTIVKSAALIAAALAVIASLLALVVSLIYPPSVWSF